MEGPEFECSVQPLSAISGSVTTLGACRAVTGLLLRSCTNPCDEYSPSPTSTLRIRFY